MGEEGAGEEAEHDRDAADDRKLRRTGFRMASRLLVVRPICNTEPPGSSAVAEGEVPLRVLGDAEVRRLQEALRSRARLERHPVLRRADDRSALL